MTQKSVHSKVTLKALVFQMEFGASTNLTYSLFKPRSTFTKVHLKLFTPLLLSLVTLQVKILTQKH